MGSQRTAGIFVAMALLLAPVSFAQAPTCGTNCANYQVEPFKIIGNVYWVGLSDHGALLLTTPQGHILVDTAAAEYAPWIRENIEKLGFKLRDVKYILGTHGHADHVGGFKIFKELTGAKLIVSDLEAPLLESGGRGDFRSPTEFYDPVKLDQTVQDGERVTFGGVTLTAHITPGHTKGCTTWTTTVEEGGKRYNAVIICQPAVAGDRAPLVNNAKYPQIAEDFAKGFKVFRSLPVEVFLGNREAADPAGREAEPLGSGRKAESLY